MARWTGEKHVIEVLNAVDEWRERCLIQDLGLFVDQPLWTLQNFINLKNRFVESPIEGKNLDFYQKLYKQLEGAPKETV